MAAVERQPVLIAAPGAALAGIAHPAAGETGVLVVPGAPQTRAGAHRGFVTMADALAGAGSPVLRFDRRGLGDSDGEDPGFRAIAPDIAAARAALGDAFPNVRRVIGIGLCDGAAALALDPRGFDALVLLNPWTRDSERAGDLPPRAAIMARYRERLAPGALIGRMLRGELNLGRALKGMLRVARPEAVPETARGMAAALGDFPGPVLIVLGERDATGLAFAALWHSRLFAAARLRPRRLMVTIPGAGHTFAGAAAADALHREINGFVRSLTG